MRYQRGIPKASYCWNGNDSKANCSLPSCAPSGCVMLWEYKGNEDDGDDDDDDDDDDVCVCVCA